MITWNANLEVGVAKIDEQHKELVAQINKLHAAMMERKGSEALGSLISFLKDYAINHFATEESLMRLHRYSKFDSHKKIHDEFKADFLKLAQELSTKPSSSLLTLEVENRLSKWLVDHIKKVDKEAMAEIIAKGAK